MAKILVTGATGYIGSRLIPMLLEAGHEVVALVRDPSKVSLPCKVIQGDLLQKITIPEDIETAYYLVHSMSQRGGKFEEREAVQAKNFVAAAKEVKQIIYLTGLITSEKLSRHLSSRLNVENIIKNSGIPYTIFRAGIIIGKGSASFQIMRDLVVKLPVMITPKWLKSRCQPIAVRDVIAYLRDAALDEKCLGHVFDIGGPDTLTYREMLLTLAKHLKRKRWLISVPFFSPRISSYWLYFVTTANYNLATSLVDSLKNDSVCMNRDVEAILPRKCLSYAEAIQSAIDVNDLPRHIFSRK